MIPGWMQLENLEALRGEMTLRVQGASSRYFEGSIGVLYISYGWRAESLVVFTVLPKLTHELLGLFPIGFRVTGLGLRV